MAVKDTSRWLEDGAGEGRGCTKGGRGKAGKGYKGGVSVALSKRYNISQTNSSFLEHGRAAQKTKQKNAMF